jgi:hypothetical protein
LGVVEPSDEEADHGTEEEGEGGRGGGGGLVVFGLGDRVSADEEADEELTEEEDGEAVDKALDEPDDAIDKGSDEDALERGRMLLVKTVVGIGRGGGGGGLGTIVTPECSSCPAKEESTHYQRYDQRDVFRGVCQSGGKCGELGEEGTNHEGIEKEETELHGGTPKKHAEHVAGARLSRCCRCCGCPGRSGSSKWVWGFGSGGSVGCGRLAHGLVGGG